MGTDHLRVLIVASDPLARAGLVGLVDAVPRCTVVGQMAPEEDVVSGLDLYRPDVMVWDLGWDPEVAFEQLAALGKGSPPVVALLSDGAQGAEVIAAGARGLLPRDVDPESLETALVGVSRGLVVMAPGLVPSPVSDGVPPQTLGAPDLTPREREVLQLVAEGMGNKSIAHNLSVSEHTVKFHVNSILGKLGAQSRTEAVTQAARLGLLLL